jgi:ribosomal protein S18 acetylase RimI-like enzyme
MQIENCTLDDLDEIFRLYDIATAWQKERKSVHWPQFGRKMIISEIMEKGHWKLIDGGEITGIWVSTFSDPQIWEERNLDPAIYLHRIAVNPEFRGNRIGHRIVEWAGKHAAENGKKYLRLDTAGRNQKLIEYYTNCGFSLVEIRKLKDTSSLPEHYHDAEICLFEMTLF